MYFMVLVFLLYYIAWFLLHLFQNRRASTNTVAKVKFFLLELAAAVFNFNLILQGIAPDGDATTTTPKSKIKTEARKLWVQVKATGETLEIDMDKTRPSTFESKEAEVEWERETAKNALKFKQLVESGQHIPEEIKQKLQAKINRTPEEDEILRQGLMLANRKEKVCHGKCAFFFYFFF